jgi:segregation and condensation protein B
MANGLGDFYDKEAVRAGLESLRQRYERTGSGVQIVDVAGGLQLVTKPEVHEQVTTVLGRRRTLSLTPAALETLSLVAYKQPISKAALEAVRGVQSDGVLKNLIELDLVRVVGREENLGRAFLYGTTKKFLEHFGLRGIKDLPRPEA